MCLCIFVIYSLSLSPLSVARSLSLFLSLSFSLSDIGFVTNVLTCRDACLCVCVCANVWCVLVCPDWVCVCLCVCILVPQLLVVLSLSRAASGRPRRFYSRRSRRTSTRLFCCTEPWEVSFCVVQTGHCRPREWRSLYSGVTPARTVFFSFYGGEVSPCSCPRSIATPTPTSFSLIKQ